MSANESVEQRLAALEAEVANLKRRMNMLPVPPDWLDRVYGCMNDNPAFEEAMRLGRELRQADKPPPDEG